MYNWDEKSYFIYIFDGIMYKQIIQMVWLYLTTANGGDNKYIYQRE